MVEQTANRLRELNEYGPVAIITCAEGYTADKGNRPAVTDEDQRRRYRLGSSLLNIACEGDGVSVTVTAPDGARNLPLDQIEQVTVDHPFGYDMPLTGRQVMKPCLMPWEEHDNVFRWAPRAYETFYGGHYYDVLESGVETDDPTIGYVRGYDISAPDAHSPWPRNTSLETAKEHDRPYSLFLVSLLRPKDVGEALTVITSRLGYDGKERMATVLHPEDYSMLPERMATMWDVAKTRVDEDVRQIHLNRLALLSGEHGFPTPLRAMDVDDAYLYATHD